ncbi:MAG: branched-chain amino acid ABC transporter permease [Deltaproteobacteria bacterium 13_1_20CM_2_69_21]|nr:MAG: branched-chain amino acid ABC transporter permease [Deltaproteobacteria bacterium 13_1_40CM_4_68_19]OLD08708.1 MAG: branched-chain amino acid ABC transporter permease [Deltaproteobacteria bacterium 13_1_40CM_3_69_14]OLD46514.1 MAG: branched-chain amino acid ABC transporter permease [Chloroflexi bacterium 13_1_40CM_2_68_14]OLE64474.1 MAG: branched-chain amino acid ABC transporter permease [Deltaproteobacteria bacterium 13_1_20CM_2_69_21]
MSFLDTLVQGVLLGGLYALFALGQSLLFGVMRLTNTAHGDFIILSAFVAWSLAVVTGSPWLALIVLLPLAFAGGYLLQRLVLNGTIGKDPMRSLVVTFGLAIVIQNVLQQIYTADPRSIDSGGLNTATFQLAEGFSIGALPLLIFAAALALTVGLQLLFDRTDLGRAFRAVSDDREAAELMGLDHRHVYALATGIAFLVVAFAGTLHGMKTTVSATDGPSLLLYAFEAVIIGGMGSFYGTLVGGMLLGVTQDIGFRIDPGWGIWTGHVVFLGALLLRPSGLFPRTR